LDNRKYIGLAVHQASISIAVVDAAGKLLMECVIETKATTIRSGNVAHGTVLSGSRGFVFPYQPNIMNCPGA
jgi:hypothetical protein